MNCPKCDAEMERLASDPDVNMDGGYECPACGEFVPEWDVDDED